MTSVSRSLLLIVPALLLTTPPTPAAANWPMNFPDYGSTQAETKKAVPKRRVSAPRKVSRPSPPQEKVSPRCLPPIEAVGDQALSENGAKENAEKAWQQEMRFARGELFADPRNAQGQAYWCVKSSIGGGLFFRCRLRAAACSPEPK